MSDPVPQMPRQSPGAEKKGVRREIVVIVIVALIIAAVFLIHPLIQRQLVSSPEPGGAPAPGTTTAKEPAQNTPASTQTSP